MSKYIGNLIGKVIDPTLFAASGVWNIFDQDRFKRKGIWPNLIPPKEYIFTGEQQTTFVVDPGAATITFAGVAMGSPGGTGGSSPVNVPGGPGGGGGASNLEGYSISALTYRGTTLYIGIGGPTSLRNTYVRTESHSGPIIFELNMGSGATGGAADPTYNSVAGGNGGNGGGRHAGGGTGTSVTNAAAGGGGGGGYGDASPPEPGGAGGPGGAVTMSFPTLILPNGGGPASPWTWGVPSPGSTGFRIIQPGGAGGVIGPAPNSWPGQPGTPAPDGGAIGGNGAGGYGGGGGGGGAGVIFNSVSYGGGGGGGGMPAAAGGNGSPGFLIIQLG